MAIVKINASITEHGDWWHVVWSDGDVTRAHQAATAVAAGRYLTDWAAEQAAAGVSTIITITWHTTTRVGTMIVNSITAGTRDA